MLTAFFVWPVLNGYKHLNALAHIPKILLYNFQLPVNFNCPRFLVCLLTIKPEPKQSAQVADGQSGVFFFSPLKCDLSENPREL